MRSNLFVVFTILAVVFLYSSSQAQLELKPTVGINFTDFSKDPETGEASARLAWQLGGTVSYGEKFYGEGGAFWVQKSNEISENSTDAKFKTDLSGIRIPVLVGYHLLGKETGLVGLRAFGGGSVFILTSVSAEGLSKDDFTSPAYGVFAGAGLDVAIFFLDLKYEWSLSDVVSISSFDIGKTRSLFINTGIRISL